MHSKSRRLGTLWGFLALLIATSAWAQGTAQPDPNQRDLPAEPAEQAPTPPAPKPSGIQFNGDARLRLDSYWTGGRPDRYRFRLRFRIGAKGDFSDNAWWGFKLATNTTDPVSRNLTLGGGNANGNGDNFGIDQAYLGFRPFDGLDLIVGKAEVPFWTTEAIFDGDLTPPGLTSQWQLIEDGAFFDSLVNTSAIYVLNELNRVEGEPTMLGTQFVAETGDWEYALGGYWFNNLNSVRVTTPGGVPTLAEAGVTTGGQSARQTVAGILPGGFAGYPTDSILTFHGRVAKPVAIGGFPITFSGDVFYNPLEDSQGLGYEFQAAFTKLGPGKGHIRLRDVGQFATYSNWADSDLGEGTGYHAGIELEYALPVARNVTFATSFFHYDHFNPLAAAANSGSVNRLFFDVSGKF